MPSPAPKTEDPDEEPPDEETDETPDVEQDTVEMPEDGEDIEVDTEEDEHSYGVEPDIDEAVEDPFAGDDDIGIDLADTRVGEDASADDVDEEVTAEGIETPEAPAPDDIQGAMAGMQQEGALTETINEGFARLAVIGLEDDEKDSLKSEFTEVFEAFQLGYFGEMCAQEYLISDPNEPVDPLMAFSVSAVMSTLVVIYMRPDGDEIVASAKDSLGQLTQRF